MTPGTARVRPATSADVTAVSAVLADAFAGYPWTTWTVAADRHEERLEGLHRLTIERVALPYGEVQVAEMPDGELVAAVAWLLPDRVVPPSVWRSWRHPRWS